MFMSLFLTISKLFQSTHSLFFVMTIFFLMVWYTMFILLKYSRCGSDWLVIMLSTLFGMQMFCLFMQNFKMMLFLLMFLRFGMWIMYLLSNVNSCKLNIYNTFYFFISLVFGSLVAVKVDFYISFVFFESCSLMWLYFVNFSNNGLNTKKMVKFTFFQNAAMGLVIVMIFLFFYFFMFNMKMNFNPKLNWEELVWESVLIMSFLVILIILMECVHSLKSCYFWFITLSSKKKTRFLTALSMFWGLFMAQGVFCWILIKINFFECPVPISDMMMGTVSFAFLMLYCLFFKELYKKNKFDFFFKFKLEKDYWHVLFMIFCMVTPMMCISNYMVVYNTLNNIMNWMATLTIWNNFDNILQPSVTNEVNYYHMSLYNEELFPSKFFKLIPYIEVSWYFKSHFVYCDGIWMEVVEKVVNMKNMMQDSSKSSPKLKGELLDPFFFSPYKMPLDDSFMRGLWDNPKQEPSYSSEEGFFTKCLSYMTLQNTITFVMLTAVCILCYKYPPFQIEPMISPNLPIAENHFANLLWNGDFGAVEFLNANQPAMEKMLYAFSLHV